MNTTFKLLSAFALTLGLAACSGSSDKTPPPPPPEPPADPVSVVDVAEADGNFTTLVAALRATGLDATLADLEGDFTVFAPNDDAFAKLGEETIEGLLNDTETLSNILLYHVLVGSVESGTAVSLAGTTVEMANEDSIGLSLSGDDLLVNLSTVIAVDVMADNGVIHVIDTVLMPPVPRGEPEANIVETAVAAGSFETLVAAVEAADLVSVLSDPDASLTVFAPTDAAFAALGEDNIAALLEDVDTLTAILAQHVIGSEVNSINAFAANGTSVETFGGADIGVSIVDGKLYFGGSEVVTKDIYTTNGIIHVIDTVIIGDVQLPTPPQSIVDIAVAVEDEFTLLVAALEAANLDGALADLDETYTVFAPTDAAFEALLVDLDMTAEELLADTELLTNVLLYHVIADAAILADAAVSVANSDEPFVEMLNGNSAALSYNNETLYINLSTVVSNNIMAANGVIHVLDKVLLPPAEMGEPVDNIVQTAINAGIFSSLVDAVQAAGLVDVLSDEDATFTVFAPTDDAFAALGDAVNQLSTEQLQQVLLHHVIPELAVDSITAFSLNGTSVGTAGTDLTVSLEIVDGMLQVEGSNIVQYDIYTTNGIIHVIDTVITSSLGE